MRILIIHTIYKVRGGEDSVVENESDLLRSAGHEVELLLFSNAENTIANVLQMPFNLSSYFKTSYKIKEFKPEVIHVHNMHFAASAAVLYAAKKNRVPVVMTLHNYRLLCPSATLFFENKLFTDSVNQTFPGKAVSKGVYQNSKLITFWVALSGMFHQIAGTWNIPAQYIVLGANAKNIFAGSKLSNITPRMAIKPNFCYPAKSAVDNNKESYFLYVGRLSTEKGISTLLEAFSRLGIKLKIAGAGPMEADVLSAASKNAHIEFLGSKSRKEVSDLIKNAEAVIFPSVWYETFGMVLIESFSCSTPVIASAIGEAKHIVTDNVNGLLFRPGDASDLIDKVNKFARKPTPEKLAMGQNALKAYQENYTPEENLQLLHKIYHAATAGTVPELVC